MWDYRSSIVKFVSCTLNSQASTVVGRMDGHFYSEDDWRERTCFVREEWLKSRSKSVQYWSTLKITLNKNPCLDIRSPFKS